jgi:thermitase
MNTVFGRTTALMLGISALLGSSSAFAAEYLVKYRSNFGSMSMLSSTLMQVEDQNDTAQLVKVEINQANELMAMIELFSNPNVEYVVPNAKVYAIRAPFDAQALKEQWAITKVNAERAWQISGRGSRNVVVAVIDTGVDYKHKNLAPNMVPGYDFIKNNNDPMDKTSSRNPGHGTHCAGIVGATGLVEGGIVGLSPEVSMMPIRFLDENGSGDLNNGIKSIDYAIEKKVDVISASWGMKAQRSQVQPLIEAIERAERAGIVFVVAAGNDGTSNDKIEFYPANANLSNTISVASTNSGDAKSSFSNFGQATVHVAAPGEAIMSTTPADKYQNLSGTSMATPLVAGLVALVKAQDKTLTASEVRSVIMGTGTKLSVEVACNCRIDAAQAMQTIKDRTMVVHPYAGTFKVNDKVQFKGLYAQGPFTYSSSNPSAGTISASGELTAVANGETIVSITDGAGRTAQSHKIIVGASGGGSDPGDPGDPGSCPLEPAMCEIACQIMPDLPWCP